MLNFDLRNAPSHVGFRHGRIWMAYELAGKTHRVNIASAAMGSDLMDAGSWISTERDNDLEVGNETDMLMDRDGWPVAMPKEGPPLKATSAVQAVPVMDRELFDLPSSGSKYTAFDDPATDQFWALTSHSTLEGSVRNGITLWRSDGLGEWIKVKEVIRGTSPAFHGFNYPFMQIDGGDIIFVSRTAWENERGQAQRWHDANMFTFHRISGFRSLPDEGQR